MRITSPLFFPLFSALFLALFPMHLSAQTSATYSPGGWPTLHQDAGNRRAVDVAVLGQSYEHWNSLAGASVLTAPVLSPDGMQLYLTTGLKAGNSNLHAYAISGDKLWQSKPWTTADNGVDACAILSSPIVDDEGDIYINDCNQLFAFHADGSSKWRIELPKIREGDWIAAGSHPVNAFTTAAFTAKGGLLGVTNFGDVLVIDRADGTQLNTPYRLPSAIARRSELIDLPDSLLAQDLIDPQFRDWVWQLIFGGSMRSANTPAVGKNNRVFIVGSSAQDSIGALYGLDLDYSNDKVTIREAFATEIGIGSGSSPALSPQEDQVYVCDEQGWFFALDAVTGEVRWRIKTDATAGAAAVGKDGRVYALQASDKPVVAMTPDGKVLWQSDISTLDGGLPDSLLLGSPVSSANGNPVVTRDAVLVPVIFGYKMPLIGAVIPVTSQLVALDLATGKGLRLITSLPDDSSGITAVLPNGTIINSLGGVMTSAASPLQTIANWLLPKNLTMLEARGGVQVARRINE